MKCRSVACIWSSSPPPHKVTAVAALLQPPTLYTGGSDGSIVWWNISSTIENHQEIQPVAMLCGHAAPIVDIGICFPAVTPEDEKTENSRNASTSSSAAECGALISVCTEGVLCVWSRGSGHCRRRRKMPPWVGTPLVIRSLPKNPRYVCIVCSVLDAAHLSDDHSLDSPRGDEPSLNRDLQYHKSSKCTVVIVDSYTLTIVQTIFHGNLSIGPPRFMGVVSPVADVENQSVVLVDSHGKVKCVPILKDPSSGGESGKNLQGDSSYNLEISDDSDGEGLQVVSFATSGLFAHVYRNYCKFRLVDSGIIIGEISLTNTQLCIEEVSDEAHSVGGMFLGSDDARRRLESVDGVVEKFVVWNSRGFAILFGITYTDNTFNYKMLSTIPAVSHPSDVRLSVYFTQLSCYLIRVESVCNQIEEPLPWKPHVTMWLLPQQYDNNWTISQECKKHGEGQLFVDWIARKNPKLASGQNSGNKHAAAESWYSQNAHLVSSSMVISDSYNNTPYAVVYGLHSGKIELVRFNIFPESYDSPEGFQRHEADSNVYKQIFIGHRSAVLCLAAHWMVNANGWRTSRILVSGSMDCTVRLWDLDSGNAITVMHHHVAPVRQIILPPPGTHRPWNNCFLSVGEDSCVSLVSLDSLRVERMFPGHSHYPTKVVWDSVRSYLACLCQTHSRTSDAHDALYIWDIKTGARERVLRGTASHSMFEHFCKGINTNFTSSCVFTGNTSASSLLFSSVEDANLPHSHSNKPEKVSSSTHITPQNALATSSKGNSGKSFSATSAIFQSNKHSVTCSCPFPGIAALSFDLELLVQPYERHDVLNINEKTSGINHMNKQGVEAEKNAPAKPDTNCPGEQSAEQPSESALHETLTKAGQSTLPETPTNAGQPSQSTLHGTPTNAGQPSQSTLHGTPTKAGRPSQTTLHDAPTNTVTNDDWIQSCERCLLQFSLSFLHLWDVDTELDKLLVTEMKLTKPDGFLLASGLQGDRGSLTLTFPSSKASLELWKTSSEFSAIRSLTMVSLAQRMVSLSHTYSAASSALAAFYTRNCWEKVPGVKPSLLQLLVSFWQDESEHVRMAARSLFHCAASRAIPLPLRSVKANHHNNLQGTADITNGEDCDISDSERKSTNGESDRILESQKHEDSLAEESQILAWLESFEVQDWISCVGATSQDAMTSHIIVAAALSIWYPCLVKPSLPSLVVHPLMKLVMAMNDKYSSTAAELLAEGMDSTWKTCIASEIPRLIGDICFQIECVSGVPANSSVKYTAAPLNMQKTLVEILLPSLAMADILGFLNVIESQIWSTASDSPVHVVSLMTVIRVIRGSPRNLAQHIDKVVNFILHTMDPSNTVLRKTCHQSSMAALKEVTRVFPMVALNDTSTRLAVGDAIAEINNASIRVYDMQSMAKMKVLDASGPPGLPNLLGAHSEVLVIAAISAISFSPDGEGLIAFSEHGLTIRWWSLGSAWWEKLSRNLVPVHCTKLIFVPPWEGSPKSTRTSIMASIIGHERQANAKENAEEGSDVDRLKVVLHNLDLSYRLQWVGEKKVILTRHGYELGTFQL